MLAVQASLFVIFDDFVSFDLLRLELIKDLFAKALQVALRTSVVHANAAIDLAAIVVVHVDLRFEFAETAGDLHAEVDYRDRHIAPLGRFLVRYNPVDRR